MADTINIYDVPMRDAGYRPRQLNVTRHDDGTIILDNPAELPWVPAHMAEPLMKWAHDDPSLLWLAERNGEDWRQVTYGEGWQLVLCTAKSLQDLGFKQRDCVMVLAQNSIDHAVLTYAVMLLGGVIFPVTPQYGLNPSGFPKLKHAYDTVNPQWVCVDQMGKYQDAVAHIGHAPDGMLLLSTVVQESSLTSDFESEILDVVHLSHNDHAKYLLTSGSTGKPKVVINTHGNLCHNVAQIRACFDDDDPITMVNALPWSHSLGGNAVLHMLTYQGGALYLDNGRPTPDKFAETVRNLTQVSPTYHLAVPAAFNLLATELERNSELAKSFFSHVKILQYGGASLGRDIYERIQRIAIRETGKRITFAAGYGATETSPTACNVHWPNDEMGMIGGPVPGTTLKLLPNGAKTELRVKGPQISPGYVNNPEKTAAAFDDDGYYILGDAVVFADPDDPQNGLKFDGRLSEDFKLNTGTWVSAGTLRQRVVAALDGLARDVVVCGENRDKVGVLVYLNLPYLQRHFDQNLTLETACEQSEIRNVFTRSIADYNASSAPAQRVGCAFLLDTEPDAASGELTDKGYLNQSLARTRHRELVQALYTGDAPNRLNI